MGDPAGATSLGDACAGVPIDFLALVSMHGDEWAGRYLKRPSSLFRFQARNGELQNQKDGDDHNEDNGSGTWNVAGTIVKNPVNRGSIERAIDHLAEDVADDDGSKSETHVSAPSHRAIFVPRGFSGNGPRTLDKKLAAEPALYCHGLDGFAAERTGLGRLGQYSCGLSTCLAVGDNPAGLAATILANDANTGAIRTKATTLVRGGVALVGHRRRSWDAWSQGHGRRHCLGA